MKSKTSFAVPSKPIACKIEMLKRSIILFFLTMIVATMLVRPFFAQQSSPRPHRNVIIFVADGLRHGSVNESDAPTLSMIRKQGVHFSNSHSLFPTFTTANASAIATGHGLGDTGDFSNALWVGYATFDTGNFELSPGTPVPFLENDQVLSDIAGHYGGDYLGETTLLTAALRHGYNIAAIGKLGPTAIQELESIAPVNNRIPEKSSTIILDDATGTGAGIPLPPQIIDGLTAAGMAPVAPTRNNGYAPKSRWDNGTPGTLRANIVQQQWFADAATHVILPDFAKDSPKPFVLLFWSRDPDATQHNTGDSIGRLSPGINGPSSRAGVHNADNNLRQLLGWLNANPQIKGNTDVFVTSDHGFATISRREISTTQATHSPAADHDYLDASGKVETPKGTLPSGFLAIDLALGMRTNVFDPDRRASAGESGLYHKVRIESAPFEHPVQGSGLLGDSVQKRDGSDAKLIVAANGGSDLIYVPDKNPKTVKQIVSLLTTFDYVGGIFVDDDQYGPLPGALPLGAIGLVGSTKMPRPAIVVAFKSFYLRPGDLQSGIQVSDTSLLEGEGMHGGFGRECTFNNMAAMGPDFKSGFEDKSPVSNADIVPTLAHILGFEIPAKGKLEGRVVTEALKNGPDHVGSETKKADSSAAQGLHTILEYQQVGNERYFDRGCFVEASVGACQ